MKSEIGMIDFILLFFGLSSLAVLMLIWYINRRRQVRKRYKRIYKYRRAERALYPY